MSLCKRSWWKTLLLFLFPVCFCFFYFLFLLLFSFFSFVFSLSSFFCFFFIQAGELVTNWRGGETARLFSDWVCVSGVGGGELWGLYRRFGSEILGGKIKWEKKKRAFRKFCFLLSSALFSSWKRKNKPVKMWGSQRGSC